MYYTYVLLSTKEKIMLLGFTQNLKTRVELQRRRFMMKGKNNGSLKLVYLEACLNKKDAVRRDKYLNSYFGRRYLKTRLKKYFASPQNDKVHRPTPF